jgi:hypothetical protein
MTDDQKGFYPFFGVPQPFDPEGKFVTARLLSPLSLGLVRFVLAVYAIATLVVDLVYTGMYVPGS